MRHEPTAYIIGRREFYGLELETTPVAPIPRPETELLVDEALAQVRRLRPTCPEPDIVDVGTGCGTIALAVATHLPAARVIATDVSQATLDLARRNADRLGLSDHVRFIRGDLLSPLDGPADIIVANLPYVPSDEWQGLAPEVRCYEPRAALDGGPDGLRLIERLLRQAPAYVRPGGAVILEIGHDQGAAVVALAREAFPTAAIAVKKDLASLDRMVVVET
jgi:release factor glutamine methyltransferase